MRIGTSILRATAVTDNGGRRIFVEKKHVQLAHVLLFLQQAELFTLDPILRRFHREAVQFSNPATNIFLVEKLWCGDDGRPGRVQ